MALHTVCLNVVVDTNSTLCFALFHSGCGKKDGGVGTSAVATKTMGAGVVKLIPTAFLEIAETGDSTCSLSTQLLQWSRNEGHIFPFNSWQLEKINS
ncbi:hypothetical protein QVD17_30279 [Tagetes erecta]|uniref:Uncharacterized protein n=1 Tax=Tagetes erecta TaxID=13708 RepID=A0AAD8K385_TARER|nr:hypothetical protein QVD17_30279 [Tagetes erecta]